MDREIKIGVRVHYTSPHSSKENGIVKSLNESGDGAFVVYHCAGEWDNYMRYTGQLTPLSNLSYGWVDENGNLLKKYCDHHYIPTNAKWQPANQVECQFCGDKID